MFVLEKMVLYLLGLHEPLEKLMKNNRFSSEKNAHVYILSKILKGENFESEFYSRIVRSRVKIP